MLVGVIFEFDYQSVRHCSKTTALPTRSIICLITSQFDTAPKHEEGREHRLLRLITSQFDTAPKLGVSERNLINGLITSQFDTAPKRYR